MHNGINKKLAFTLPEAVMTLIMITVISVLTVPNFLPNTRDKSITSNLQNAYAILSEAQNISISQNGYVNTWFTNTTEDATTIYIDKIMQNLNGKLTASSDTAANSRQNIIELHNNIKYEFDISNSCDGNGSYGIATVDINNGNDQTIYGIDTFVFAIKKDHIGYRYNFVDNNLKKECFGNAASRDCTQWVMKFGNTDYINANSNGVCQNGTSLSISKTTCK